VVYSLAASPFLGRNVYLVQICKVDDGEIRLWFRRPYFSAFDVALRTALPSIILSPF